jgi:hypothetical protein
VAAAPDDSGAAAVQERPAQSRPKRSKKGAAPVYVAPRRGELPWGELAGSAQAGAQLRDAASQVMDLIETLANPLGSDHPNIQRRKDELIEAVFQRTESVEAIHRTGGPTAAHQVVANGIAHKLRDMRAANIHKGVYGRVAYDAVMQAAICEVEDGNARKADLARVLDVHRSSIYLALERNEKCLKEGEIVMLDPTRKQRSDAAPAETRAAIQNFWAANTRPSPDCRPVAVLKLANGDKATHGIHWQEHSQKDLFELYCEDTENPTVGRELFRLNKPYFVKDPKWSGCLCPTCHVLSLLRDGLEAMLKECVASANKCTCSFCERHRVLHAASKEKGSETSYPPQSSSQLYAAMFCAKKVAANDSGFSGTMPTYELGCLRSHLEGKQASFIDGSGNNPALLDTVPECCPDCAGKFPLSPPPECTFCNATGENTDVSYKKYVAVPRIGRTDASDREDLQVVDVERRVFLESMRAQVSGINAHLLSVPPFRLVVRLGFSFSIR